MSQIFNITLEKRVTGLINNYYRNKTCKKKVDLIVVNLKTKVEEDLRNKNIESALEKKKKILTILHKCKKYRDEFDYALKLAEFIIIEFNNGLKTQEILEFTEKTLLKEIPLNMKNDYKNKIANCYGEITSLLINQNRVQSVRDNDFQIILDGLNDFMKQHDDLDVQLKMMLSINLGYYNYIMGYFTRSFNQYSSALNIYESNHLELPLFYCKIYEGLANAAEARNEYLRAEKYYNLALKIYDEKYKDTDHPKISFYNNLATFYRKILKHIDAEKITKKIIEMVELNHSKFGINDIDYVIFYCEAGNLYFEVDQWDKSEKCFQDALSIGMVLDENSLQVARTRHGLGRLYLSKGQYSDAESEFKKCLESRVAILGKSHQDTILIYNSLAKVYNMMGLNYLMQFYFKEIQPLVDDCNIKEDVNTSYTAMFLLNIASFLSVSKEKDKKEKSEELLKKAKKILHQVYPEHDDINRVELYTQVANIYCNLENNNKTLKFHMNTINIYYQNEGLSLSSNIILSFTNTFKFLIQHFCSQKMFDKSINYCNDAITFCNNQKNHTQHEIDIFKILLVNNYIENAKYLISKDVEDEKTSDLLENAMKIVIDLFNKHKNIIKSNTIKSPYDLSAIYPFITIIGKIHGYLGEPEEAAKKFMHCAEHLSANYSVWKVLYLKKAIARLKKLGLPKSKNDLYECYFGLANIFWLEKLNDKARKYMEKAIFFEENPAKKNELNEKLIRWSEELESECGLLDSDIYIQLQRAKEFWFEIKISLVQQANKSILLKNSSPIIENMVADLSIKIRALLDQGYARIIRQSIYEENGFFTESREGERYWRELYYPYKTDWNLINKNWQERKIITNHSLPMGKKNQLEIKSIKKLILGYSDFKENNLINNDGSINANTNITNGLLSLHEDYLPYLDIIEDSIKSAAKENEKIQKHIHTNIKKIPEPPLIDDIIEVLKNLQLIEVLEDEIIVKQKFLDENDISLGFDNFIGEGYTRYEEIIKKRLLSLKPKKNFELDCQKSAKLIQNEHPCTYYDPDKNIDIDFIQGPWLTAIVGIANESKHVGIASQSISDITAMQQGLILFRETIINVRYVDTKPNLTKWSFAKILNSCNNRLTSRESIDLSQQMKCFFEKNNYFERIDGIDVLCQPNLKKIYNMVFNNDDKGLVYDEMRNFHRLLQNDLPYEHKQYSQHLAVFFILWKLKEAHLQLDDTYLFEIESLFDKALSKTEDLLKTFSGDRLGGKIAKHSWKKNLYAISEINISSLGKDLDELNSIRASFDSNLINQINGKSASTGKVDFKLLREWHQLNLFVAEIYLSNSNFFNAGAIFLDAGKLVKDSFGWLSIQYIKKSASIFKKELSKFCDLLEECYTLCGEIYFASGNYLLADRYKIKAYEVNYSENSKKIMLEFSDKKSERIEKFHEEKDIFFQLECVNKSFLELQYSMFKLTLNVNNTSLRNLISNVISEIAIKLHHILDHTWGRYLKMLFYFKNLKLNDARYDFHFPYALSDDCFSKLLSHGRNNEIQVDDFDNEVIAALDSCQPYNVRWLEHLMRISNTSKHDFMFIPSEDVLKESLNKTDLYYPLEVPVISINKASFNDEFNAEVSSKLFDLLKMYKYIKSSDTNLGEIQDECIQELVRIRRQKRDITTQLNSEIQRLSSKNKIFELIKEKSKLKLIILHMMECYDNYLGFDYSSISKSTPLSLINGRDFLCESIESTTSVVEVLLKNMYLSYKSSVPLTFDFWTSLHVDESEQTCKTAQNGYQTYKAGT